MPRFVWLFLAAVVAGSTGCGWTCTVTCTGGTVGSAESTSCDRAASEDSVEESCTSNGGVPGTPTCSSFFSFGCIVPTI